MNLDPFYHSDHEYRRMLLTLNIDGRRQNMQTVRRILRRSILIGLLASSTTVVEKASASPRVGFVTSTAGTGNLASWADSGGATGIDAGDAICQARARDAGLSGPANYVAWLSDANTDAYCHVFGLKGKKAASCQLSQLPIGAGPWVRTDGLAFAETIERALDEGLVYAPLNVDEYVHVLPTDSSFVYTGTGTQGTDIGNCQGWSTTSSFAGGVGDAFFTAGDWTSVGEDFSCATNAHLVCLQAGSGDELPPVSRSGQREAFVTSIELHGNLDESTMANGESGLAAGDAICRSLAQSAGLYAPAQFKAFLGNRSTTAVSRFQNDGPFFRLDGRLFADDLAQLSSGTVRLPLNLTETGIFLGEGRNAFFEDTVAWTGARVDGTPSTEDCGNWSNELLGGATSAPVNSIGSGSLGGTWIGGRGQSKQCSESRARLFCLSDSDVIFHDSFEK